MWFTMFSIILRVPVCQWVIFLYPLKLTQIRCVYEVFLVAGLLILLKSPYG